MTPCWKLEIFGPAGDITTVVEKSATSPFTVTGSLEAILPALPSISGLARFFADPDQAPPASASSAAARAAYSAFASAWETTYGTIMPIWDQVLQSASPAERESFLHTWTSVASAASAIDPALN